MSIHCMYVTEAIAAAENVDATAVKVAMPEPDVLHNPDGEEVLWTDACFARCLLVCAALNDLSSSHHDIPACHIQQWVEHG